MTRHHAPLAVLLACAACGDSSPMMMNPPPGVLTVKAGASIQAAVAELKSGMTVEVEPGLYKQTIDIGKERQLKDIVVRGLVRGGERAVLDGEGQRQNGIFVAEVEGLTIEGFELRNYKENGVWVGKSKRVVFRDLIVDATGKYGVFPQECVDVTIERCTATNVKDAGLYVGQTTGTILVQDNVAHKNVAGIECENSLDCIIRRNKVYDNTGGILVFTLPNLMRKDCLRAQVYDNVIEANNTPNFAAPSDVVAKVPSGAGVVIIGADAVDVRDNTIKGNQGFAVAIVSLTQLTGTEPIDVDPDPSDNKVHGNKLEGNGTGEVDFMGVKFPGCDFAFDGSGKGNCQKDNGVAMPKHCLVELPTCP